MPPEERLERYARLAVEVGSNVGAGQLVWISALPEHAPLVRAIARCAYENGARYVDVDYSDQHVRRARIEHADGGNARLDAAVGAHEGRLPRRAARRAWSQIVGDPEPELLADLDGARVGKTRMRELAERYVKATNQRLLNWTIVAYPNEGWATSVFGEPDVERLWDAVVSATRLDEPDPVDAWRRHIAKLVERASAAERAPVRRIRFRGPGTDLTVGLTPRSNWCTALEETVDGRRHVVEHADGGGVHDARPPPHRGNRSLDQAAGARGQRRPRPRDALRGRPRGRGQGELGRGRRPRADAHRRRRVDARRGRARRRRLARRPDRPRLPEHALRRERELPHRLRHRAARRRSRAATTPPRPSSRRSASTPRRSTPTS